MLLQIPSVKLYRVRGSIGYILYAIAVSAVVLVLTLIGIDSSVYIIYFLLAALALGIRIYLSLPRAFLHTPYEPEGSAGEDVSCGFSIQDGKAAREVFENGGSPPSRDVSTGLTEPTGRAARRESAGSGEVPAKDALSIPMERSYRWYLHMTCFRLLNNRWYMWVVYVLLALYSLLIVLAYYDGGRKDNPYGFIMYLWIWIALMYSISRLRRLDFLPVSRKTLFAYAMLPLIVSMLLGFGAGQTMVHINRRNYRQIHFYHHTIQIPDEFWEITNDGEPPVLTSPWGEKHVPEHYPLYKGSSIVIYKPFDCAGESSARFVALQLDRAAERIHGIPFDHSSMYEDIDESFEKAVACGCFTFEGTIGRGSQKRNRAFGWAAIFLVTYYIIILSLQFRGIRRAGWRTIGAFSVVISVVLFGLIVVVVVFSGMAGYCKPLAVAAVPAVLTRRLGDAVPVGGPLLWSVFAVLCVAGYFILQSAFRKIEAPADRPKPFLNDF
jgi:hypothetical protein